MGGDQSGGGTPGWRADRPAFDGLRTLLREYVAASGMSMSALAKRTGFHRSQLQRAFNGVELELSDNLAFALDRALNADSAIVVARNAAYAEKETRQTEVPAQAPRFEDRGGDDPTKRRDFGKAMALALAPLPTRMARTAVDENSGTVLMAITGAQRRLDATTSARELSRGVVAHVEMTDRLLARATGTPFVAELAAAGSEAAGFAAWLHADMYDVGTARVYYRMAIDRARRARHELLAGYMLGSLAAFEVESGHPAVGLTLIAEARDRLGVATHATPQAWLDANEAVGLAAARRDGDGARLALARAESAIDKGWRSEGPPWPWVFPFDHVKLAGYRALVAVRLARPSEALDAFAESVVDSQLAPKQRALVMIEVATALCQDGTARRDRDRIDDAFRLGREALEVGVTYSSERVIERARRFRREYAGQATSHVQEFDENFREAMQ